MSESTQQQIRELKERVGSLERHTANIEQYFAYYAVSGAPFGALLFSTERNDKAVQDVGFDEEIENALHRNNVFNVSQILNLGKRWLDNAPDIGPTKADEIKLHLARLGARLPD